MKKCLLLLLLACGSLWAKQLNRYSVITLINETPFRISYAYAWGPGTDEWHNSIEPYGTYVHWWEFSHPGEDWAPWFYLRLDGEPGWHKLRSFFSPTHREEDGHTYYFESFEWMDGYHEIKLTEELYSY